MTACIEKDSRKLAAAGTLLARLRSATPDVQDGLRRYLASAEEVGKGEVDSIVDRLAEVADDAAALEARMDDFIEIFEILSTVDGNLTPGGRKQLVRDLWRGGPTDMFRATLGVMKTLREIKRLGLGTPDAFYLVEVRDPGYHRIVDILVHERPFPGAPDLPIVSNDLIVASVEVKWYLPETPFGSASNIGQVYSDIMRMLTRDMGLDQLRYAFPSDYPIEGIAAAADDMHVLFDVEVREILAAGISLDDGTLKVFSSAEVDQLLVELDALFGSTLILVP